MKWPEAWALEFSATMYGSPGICKVFRKVDGMPWNPSGLGLGLGFGHNNRFSCYLGNPEEWKQRLDAELAKGMLPDKCGKTSLWAYGEAGNQNENRPGHSSTFVPRIYVGKLSSPDPLGGTEGGRKLCLKWVRGNAKCDGAVGINLLNDQCYCLFSTPWVVGRAVPRPPTEEVPSNGFLKEVCLLK